MKKPTEKFRIPRIAALIHSNALASSVTLPMELSMAAGQAAGQVFDADNHVSLLSPEGGMITTSGGLTVETKAIDSVGTLDLLVISAIWRDPRRVLTKHPSLVPFIRRIAESGAAIAAVGTGSFLLAETGLLRRKAATTHWFWFDEFAKRYPEIDLRRDQLIVQSNNLYCAGSVNSISDLLVYLMGGFYNPEVARRIENQFSPEIRQRFRTTQLGSHMLQEHYDEIVMDLQLYMREKLRAPVSTIDFAGRYGLSERTLSRRFQRATGTTPWQFLLTLRMSEAATLLRTTNLSVTQVAAEVGITDSAHFARQFKKTNQLTPTQYRKAVRGKMFSAN
ncbi:helix-turn-helix domain-containing protein [Candidatus Paraluminiphilus aquimaris]|uniref:Helix-turn-helix domain-containing protein n=1 Tax=Candidatus Paraluminiphilus aquimaris TaxID=2518994 RepID=A0ABY6QAA2_9GAMM|nr:helix-turn-helix domain-containing protein [Candidatus Paraluminiphilus aquimaris]UZP75166.1 helix-turn-helix domain-containing protein [Candidatus Paraluminiphilus aquimaris]